MADERTLDGQVAIVTGGVRRLGRAMALALARDGAAVVVNARSSREEADRTAAEVEKAGARALVHLADITDEAAVGAMVDTVMKTFGRVDILINNAAVRAEAHFLDMSLKQWHEVLSVILDGAFLCSRAVLPHMLKNKYGRIIILGGVSTHLGAPGRAHVGTGKLGIIGFTKAIASEFAPHGITVNCVSPGPILTGLRQHSRAILGGMPDMSDRGVAANDDLIRALIPAQRRGTVEEVAAAVCFLASDEAGYVTGHSLVVDGGWRAK